MTTTQRPRSTRSLLALCVVGAAGLLAAPVVVRGASATALVSATVLGPAGEETASGAVTLSRVAVSAVEIARATTTASASSTLARFRVGGGTNASFAVALPESAVAQSANGRVEVSGFRAAGGRSLGPDGSSLLSVGAEIRVPAGQAPGQYQGSYPVTIAYD